MQSVEIGTLGWKHFVNVVVIGVVVRIRRQRVTGSQVDVSFELFVQDKRENSKNFGFRLRHTDHLRKHKYFEIRSAESPIPIVGDMTAVHDLAEQIAQILPRYFGIGLQVVVEHVDADRQIADVERIFAIPALRTELSSFRDDSVEIAK